MPARILFVSHTAQLYGAPESLLLLLRGLARERFEPAVFCPYHGPLTDRLDELGVPVRVGLRDARRDALSGSTRLGRAVAGGAEYVRSLRAAIDAHRPDLVYLNSAGIAVPAVMALAHRIPFVVHVREARSYFAGLGNRLRRLPLLRGARRIVTVSRAVRDVVVAHGGRADRITVVHNGVDLVASGFDQAGRVRVRRELGVDDTVGLVGLVGAIEARKGVLDFVDAAVRIAGNRPDVRFVVVGGSKDDEYFTVCRQRAAALGAQFTFLGFRGDVAAVLSALDVVANPTREEPFARINLEAMAAGRVVVATDVDGNPEAIVDGATGILVAPDDASALADGIEAVLADDVRRDAMGSAARQRAETEFGADRYVDGVRRVVEEVLPA